MSTERQQQAVGYVRVATGEEIGTGAQVERHKHTIIRHCLDSGLKLTHMIIDIGGGAGRGRALDLLVMERAAVLVGKSSLRPPCRAERRVRLGLPGQQSCAWIQQGMRSGAQQEVAGVVAVLLGGLE